MGDRLGIDKAVLWWLLAWPLVVHKRNPMSWQANPHYILRRLMWAECTNSARCWKKGGGPFVSLGDVIQPVGACLWKKLCHGVMNHVGSLRSCLSYPGVMADARVCPLFLLFLVFCKPFPFELFIAWRAGILFSTKFVLLSRIIMLLLYLVQIVYLIILYLRK